MMSLHQLAALLGRRVYLDESGILIECIVRDAKISYGNPRLLIAPIAGKGQAWVSAARLTDDEGGQIL
jgi:hypothetical protein